MTYYFDYCPNCDYRLEVKQDGKQFIILDNEHPVTVCPNCLIALIVDKGELKHDRPNIERWD